MGAKDRTIALNSRRQAVAIIKSIRHARRMLARRPFDEKTFNLINGMDRGIEALLGKPIAFGLLDEPEVLQLKRDINAKLNESEAEAFKTLRDSTVAFFADLKKAITRVGAKITDKNISDVTLDRKPKALEAFLTTPVAIGGLDYERSMSAIEHMVKVAAEVDETVPEVQHEIDDDEMDTEEDEYTEEQHEEEANRVGEEVEPPNEPDPLEEEPEDDPSLPIELPDDDSEDEELSDDDEGEEVVADITWIRGEESYLNSASNFVVANEGYTVAEGEFTPDKAKAVMASYADGVKRYRDALEHLYNVVNPEECTLESLINGKTITYRRLNRIMTLVDRFENLRTALDTSCECLVAASENMLKQAIIDPLA